MLLNFSFENFKSFMRMQEFSMVASETPPEAASEYLSYDADRLIVAGDSNSRILPVTAIFGGNAFGKSNFTEALFFIRYMVMEGPMRGTQIPINTFFLNSGARNKPASFELNILSQKSEYKIFIKLDNLKIIEEKISMVKKGADVMMYHRKGKDFNINGKQFQSIERLEIAHDISEKNSLIISSKILEKMKEFTPIHDWFNKNLLIMNPTSQFTFLDDSRDFVTRIGAALNLLDTGVKSIEMVEMDIHSIPLPKEQIDMLIRNVKAQGITYFRTPANDIFIMKIEDGKIVAKSMAIVKEDDQRMKFNMPVSAESDGTQRLLDLLPAILEAAQPDHGKVLIIDELDRSLHTNMTKALIKYHLESLNGKTASQLIFTTHDVNLIDEDILRKDEIWIIQKDRNGASEMVCLDEFEENKSKLNFRQLYESHYLGGTPEIELSSHSQLMQIVNYLNHKPEASPQRLHEKRKRK